MTTPVQLRRMPPVSWRRSGSILLASTFFLVACNSAEDKPEAKPPTTPVPMTTSVAPATPAPDPSELTKSALVHLYRNYWAEVEKAYEQGSTKETRLSDFAAGLALSKAQKNVTNHSTAGRVTKGTVSVNSLTVTMLDLNRKVPNAKLSTCLDISQWTLIDKATKKRVDLPSGRLTRYVIVTTLEKWPQGWRVVVDEPQDQAC
ncbi:hypothetical protein [Streptomyces gardneri]|uniref:hypothetical protein n=1 Tax=Streptomyces gardneri TaxID=66892 RepID=UPI0035DBFB39